jgi:hypothetical protein
MNANELADKIEDARNETDFQRWAGQAPDMLRQQQARIEALEVNVKFWVAMAEKERVRADRYEQ